MTTTLQNFIAIGYGVFLSHMCNFVNRFVYSAIYEFRFFLVSNTQDSHTNFHTKSFKDAVMFVTWLGYKTKI